MVLFLQNIMELIKLHLKWMYFIICKLDLKVASKSYDEDIVGVDLESFLYNCFYVKLWETS